MPDGHRLHACQAARLWERRRGRECTRGRGQTSQHSSVSAQTSLWVRVCVDGVHGVTALLDGADRQKSCDSICFFSWRVCQVFGQQNIEKSLLYFTGRRLWIDSRVRLCRPTDVLQRYVSSGFNLISYVLVKGLGTWLEMSWGLCRYKHDCKLSLLVLLANVGTQFWTGVTCLLASTSRQTLIL